MAALEAAVSADFGVREGALYSVVHAQVLLANGRVEEAKKVGVGGVVVAGRSPCRLLVACHQPRQTNQLTN
jgi:hypothetical protein